ncbi:MAG: Fic family protein [Luteolibacter sp.]
MAERFEVATLPYWRESRVLAKGVRRLVEKDGKQVEYLPASRDPGDGVFAQLEFALKREGLHLELLRKVMPLLDGNQVAEFVRSKPTGRYARVIWYLYEGFTRRQLDMSDLEMGGYVDLLDEKIYVVGPVKKIRRQRINMNLLGTLDFSPMIRKKGLGEWSEEVLKHRCAEIAGEYPPEIFARAVRYLYAKESKSSYEIERETPDQKRAEKFIGLLEQAWHQNFFSKQALVELQQAIVDPRYANAGWRDEAGEQVYVGETLAPNLERVHFAAPRPEDIDELMTGFFAVVERTAGHPYRMTFGSGKVSTERRDLGVPTLVAAAVVSFVFNFLHPFSDGNGRIHRFLLHHVLAQRRFGPEGIILPVSAVILNRPRDYDHALESFSKPLMELVEYTMDDRQRMTVTNDTIDFYRYIDCTELTRITIDFIRETIETELPAELRYLNRYDGIRNKMRDVVELPDRIARLFVSLCTQNGGRLSAKKRKLAEFVVLSDSEISELEEIIRDGLGM